MGNPEHSARKHSKYGPSSSERWLTCPGSIRLSEGVPVPPESSYAREGTEAHECLEFLVRRFGALKTATAEAKTRWPHDMVDHCVRAAKVIFDLRPSPSAKLLIETRVSLRHIAPGIFGTLDYAWVEDWGTLVVIDFKYGRGVLVEAADEDGSLNTQLLFYANGLAKLADYDFERVKIAIVQPRVYDEDEEPLVVADVPMKVLRAFETRVLEAWRTSKRPDAPIVAGDHCRWCPALAECPEQQRSLAKADVVFDIEDGLQAVPEVRTLSEKTMPKLLDACTQLENWIEAVRARALQMAESGVKIKGYKLVNKRATYVWNANAERAAATQFGAGAYELSKRMLTPAKLRDQHGAAGKAFVEKHTTAVINGKSLVSEKDKRSELHDSEVFDFEIE